MIMNIKISLRIIILISMVIFILILILAVLVPDLNHPVGGRAVKDAFAKNTFIYFFSSVIQILFKRRCQIKVQFESGVKTKFLAPIFQSMTSISDYQSIPRSHSFQNMYNTYMCKMHLKGGK